MKHLLPQCELLTLLDIDVVMTNISVPLLGVLVNAFTGEIHTEPSHAPAAASRLLVLMPVRRLCRAAECCPPPLVACSQCHDNIWAKPALFFSTALSECLRPSSTASAGQSLHSFESKRQPVASCFPLLWRNRNFKRSAGCNSSQQAAKTDTSVDPTGLAHASVG